MAVRFPHAAGGKRGAFSLRGAGYRPGRGRREGPGPGSRRERRRARGGRSDLGSRAGGRPRPFGAGARRAQRARRNGLRPSGCIRRSRTSSSAPDELPAARLLRRRARATPRPTACSRSASPRPCRPRRQASWTGPTCAVRAAASDRCTRSATSPRSGCRPCPGGRGGAAIAAGASPCPASPTAIASAVGLARRPPLVRPRGRRQPDGGRVAAPGLDGGARRRRPRRGRARQARRPAAPASCSCARTGASTRWPTAARTAAARSTRATSTATRSSAAVHGPAASGLDGQPRGRPGRAHPQPSLEARVHDGKVEVRA